jgi:hypothetical protein
MRRGGRRVSGRPLLLRPHFRPGITLARRSDNGARPRTPGLMSLPRRRIGANSGLRYRLHPPINHSHRPWISSGVRPRTQVRRAVSMWSPMRVFRRGTFVCLSLVISLVVVWHLVGGSQPHKCELPPDGCAAWPRRACPERWLPEEGIRKRSRVGRVCAGAGLTSAAWPRGVIVATRTTGAGAALSPSARRRSSRPITVSLTVKRSSHRLQIVSAEAVPYN